MPASSKSRYIVVIDSEDSDGPATYGVYNDYERAAKFADAFNAQVERKTPEDGEPLAQVVRLRAPKLREAYKTWGL